MARIKSVLTERAIAESGGDEALLNAAKAAINRL